MSPPATSWQPGEAGCNNEEQRQPSESAFSFGHAAHACCSEPGGLSETERSKRVCFALVSDIAGQDVNCTSRLLFVLPASSVLPWLLFRQWGGQVYMPTLFYMQRRACVSCFPTFGGKHSYSSCLVYFGSSLTKCAAGKAEYFSFWLFPPCFQKHTVWAPSSVKDLWLHVQEKQQPENWDTTGPFPGMSRVHTDKKNPCIIHICGSNLILTTSILHFWSYNVHPSGGGCY